MYSLNYVRTSLLKSLLLCLFHLAFHIGYLLEDWCILQKFRQSDETDTTSPKIDIGKFGYLAIASRSQDL
jgi:hypothetical protein